MQKLIEFIVVNSHLAPYLSFGLILLAGFNLPFSIDVIMVVSAVLAATAIPEQTYPLYFSILFGTYFSAWIAYGLGRTVGRKLLNIPFLAKVLHKERMSKIEAFYNKHGFLTLLFGRFIPFGVRNCLFMTAGMSRSSFTKFALRDIITCFIWTSATFYTFYSIGHNYQLLIQKVKVINIIIFLAFSVTVIALFWYKKRKKKQISE